MYNQITTTLYLLCFVIGIKFTSVSVVAFSKYFSSLYTTKIFSYFVTPIIEVLYNVHREYYIILTSILVLILYIMFIELLYFRNIEYRYSIVNSFVLELLWSILPSIIILHFMMMTIALLYVSDEHPFFGFHVKVIGHQWYWEYEIVRCFSSIESVYTNMSESLNPDYLSNYNIYSKCNSYCDFFHNNLASVTFNELVLSKVNFIKYESERMLDTEGILYVPYRIHVRLLITSMDVIHAFAIPSLGIKVDAIPGRLNDLHFFLTDNSAMTHYFGQCSELCGVGHAFMPVHMVSI